jgi:hypothetical protein
MGRSCLSICPRVSSLKVLNQYHFSLVLGMYTLVELAVSHRVPPQVAYKEKLNTYICGRYRGSKILGADKNRQCCPAAVVGTTGARGMGPRQKTPGYA